MRDFAKVANAADIGSAELKEKRENVTHRKSGEATRERFSSFPSSKKSRLSNAIPTRSLRSYRPTNHGQGQDQQRAPTLIKLSALPCPSR